MTITWRPRSREERTQDDAISRAGWYPIEAHERYWTGEVWSDHVRSLRW